MIDGDNEGVVEEWVGYFLTDTCGFPMQGVDCMSEAGGFPNAFFVQLSEQVKTVPAVSAITRQALETHLRGYSPFPPDFIWADF